MTLPRECERSMQVSSSTWPERRPLSRRPRPVNAKDAGGFLSGLWCEDGVGHGRGGGGACEELVCGRRRVRRALADLPLGAPGKLRAEVLRPPPDDLLNGRATV